MKSVQRICQEEPYGTLLAAEVRRGIALEKKGLWTLAEGEALECPVALWPQSGYAAFGYAAFGPRRPDTRLRRIRLCRLASIACARREENVSFEDRA